MGWKELGAALDAMERKELAAGGLVQAVRANDFEDAPLDAPRPFVTCMCFVAAVSGRTEESLRDAVSSRVAQEVSQKYGVPWRDVCAIISDNDSFRRGLNTPRVRRERWEHVRRDVAKAEALEQGTVLLSV